VMSALQQLHSWLAGWLVRLQLRFHQGVLVTVS